MSACPDIVTTTFFTFQLRSAKVAGLSIPPEAFVQLLHFFEQLQDEESHSFRGWMDGSASPLASFMGCLSCRLLGLQSEALEPYVATPDVLLNYIGTLVLFQQGGDGWKAGNEQRRRGWEFCRKEGADAGSWDPCGMRSGMGRVGISALMALSLSVYHRGGYPLKP